MPRLTLSRLFALTALVGSTVVIAADGPGFFGRERSHNVRAFDSASGPAPVSTATEAGRKAYLNLPMVFERNVGQASADADFVARGHGYTLDVRPSGARLSLRGSAGSNRLEMRLAHASPRPQVVPLDPQQGHSNYIVGDDRSKDLLDIPHFGRVEVRQVYTGARATPS